MSGGGGLIFSTLLYNINVLSLTLSLFRSLAFLPSTVLHFALLPEDVGVVVPQRARDRLPWPMTYIHVCGPKP